MTYETLADFERELDRRGHQYNGGQLWECWKCAQESAQGERDELRSQLASLTARVDDAKREQMKLDCKLICNMCADEIEFCQLCFSKGQYFHMRDPLEHYSRETRCHAYKIRAAHAAAPGAGGETGEA